MNSAPKTNQLYPNLYQVPSDINAPMMGEQRNIYNNLNTTNSTGMEREMFPINNLNNNLPRNNPPQLNVTQNQTMITQYEVNNISKILKSSGQFIACPYCKAQGVTRTEETCSLFNVSCGVIFGPIPWILFQALRRKDINCYDAEHHCIQCGSKLATYKAC